jgi:hypothetical protein
MRVTGLPNSIHRRWWLGLCVAAVLTTAPLAPAAIDIKINYDLLRVRYDPGTNSLTLTDTANSTANAFLQNTVTNSIVPGTLATSTSTGFEMALETTISNPAGLDNLSMAGDYAGADALRTLANPSLAADVANASNGPDADGFVWDLPKQQLTISGILTTIPGNDSILLNPLGPGAWTYVGELGAFVIPPGQRDLYQNGTLAILQLSLNSFTDGTAIFSTNADELFADAAAHNGFGADSAQLQLTVNAIPAPDAMLLGVLGMVLVTRGSWWSRVRHPSLS